MTPHQQAAIQEMARREMAKRELARRQGGGAGQPAPAPQAAPAAPQAAAPEPSGPGLVDRIMGMLPEVKIGTPNMNPAPETNGEYTRPRFDTGALQPNQPNRGERLANAVQGADRFGSKTIAEAGQAASDMMNVYGDSWTSGLGDAAIERFNPQAQEQTEASRERLGNRALIPEIAGAITSPTIFARGPMMAWKGGKTILHGIEGGASGVADAWAKGTPVSELPGVFAENAGLSAAFSKGTGIVSDWLQGRKLAKTEKFKDAKDLRAGAKDEYRKVDSSASRWKEGQFRQLRAQLSNMNLTPGVDDPAINFLKKLEKDWTGKSISPRELDDVRKNIGYKVLGTSENAGNMKRVRGEMTNVVDQFTKNNPPTKPQPKGQFGPEAPDRQVMADLDKARGLHSKRAQLARVEREEKRAAREHTRGFLNPFGPSLESGRVKKFNTLGQQIEEGKAPANYPQKIVDKIEHLGNPTLVRRLGGAAEHLSPSGSLFPWGAAALGSLIPGAGFVGPVVAGGSELLHRIGTRKTNKELRELKEAIRDPSGNRSVREKVDKNASQKDRLRLAKIAARLDREKE